MMDTMFTVRDGCLLVTMPKEMDHYKVDMIRKSIDQYLLSVESQIGNGTKVYMSKRIGEK